MIMELDMMERYYITSALYKAIEACKAEDWSNKPPGVKERLELGTTHDIREMTAIREKMRDG